LDSSLATTISNKTTAIMAMARNDEDNEQHNKTDDEGKKTCHSKVQDMSQEDNIKTEF